VADFHTRCKMKASFDDCGEAWTIAHDVLGIYAADDHLEQLGVPSANRRHERAIGAAREIVRDVLRERSSALAAVLELDSGRRRASRAYGVAASHRSPDSSASSLRDLVEESGGAWNREASCDRVADPLRPLRDALDGSTSGGGTQSNGGVSEASISLISCWLASVVHAYGFNPNRRGE
jgi:hypothetical protein